MLESWKKKWQNTRVVTNYISHGTKGLTNIIDDQPAPAVAATNNNISYADNENVFEMQPTKETSSRKQKIILDDQMISTWVNCFNKNCIHVQHCALLTREPVE